MTAADNREVPAGGAHRVAVGEWTGRDDGPGAEHRRWYNLQRATSAAGEQPAGPGVSLIGFACDEGVRRNQGRQGAFDGPRAIRRQLAPMATHRDFPVRDLGDVVVSGQALEQGQELLGRTVAEGLADGLTVTLGGGHETAWGTFQGLDRAGLLSGERRLGILNFDAHFDLRQAPRPTSGTPFRQMADAQQAAGRDFRYAVVGISPHSNTDVLFNAALELGVQALLDTDCHETTVVDFVAAFASSVDDLYVTVDLDVLPASVAPGVSAPAAFGVELRTILAGVRAAARTGKVRVADIVELNPAYDVDQRTARSAARIVADLVTGALAAADAQA